MLVSEERGFDLMNYDSIRPVMWKDDRLELIDQRLLPHEEKQFVCESVEDVRDAISEMVVRGAPAIGCTAAFGMVFAARSYTADAEKDEALLVKSSKMISKTRPTAVNLFWALDRMERVCRKFLGCSAEEAGKAALAEASAILEEDLTSCRAIGEFGADLIARCFRCSTLMTHCNAGALATAGYGTALGVARSAYGRGLVSEILACETRPRQQGARLTAWELHKDGLPVKLISDTAAGHMIKTGRVQCVCVGADRIGMNGDTANKIGTYSIAVVAKENGVPFLVAAPVSTIDGSCAGGDDIVIEERSPDEVLFCGGKRIAPEGVDGENPAFDVTPARYIRAIITEKGVAEPPFEKSFERWLRE